jgi:H+/gluconate symporter-like permease
VFALFIGIFTILFGLILAIPLTIAALITGKKLEKSLKANHFNFRDVKQDKERVLEGEYEEVTK